jgi:hypothetical protein
VLTETKVLIEYFAEGPHTYICARIEAPVVSNLLDDLCRDLLSHSEVGAEAMYETICKLNQHDLMQPTSKETVRLPHERNHEVFRLRIIEAVTLAATANLSRPAAPSSARRARGRCAHVVGELPADDPAACRRRSRS